MTKKISLPHMFILISFLYSVTHLREINQITVTTFLDVLQLFYSIYFWILLFSIATYYQVFTLIGKIFSPVLSRMLHLNSIEISIYLASIFSGYPTYAKIIKDHQLNKESTLHLIKICSHPSIGFVVTTLGTYVFEDLKIGYCLFFIQVLSNFFIAIICRPKEITLETICETSHNNYRIIELLKIQFKNIFEVFIYIFGFMLVFRILIYMIPGNNILITGILEFSQGCLELYNYPKQVAFCLCSCFLSFSSLSVISQSLSILDIDNAFTKMIIIRFFQALISCCLSFLMSFFIF